MIDAARQNVLSARAARRGGFTLVELLLVMFVMSVLVAMVVGVGSYVIAYERKEETKASQDRVLGALDAYRKVTGKIPKNDADPNKSMNSLVTTLAGKQDGSKLEKRIYKETSPFLGQAGGGSLQNDAYGRLMRYFSDGGMGGRPLIISAGPDGYWGDIGKNDTEREQKRSDNIRSDTR